MAHNFKCKRTAYGSVVWKSTMVVVAGCWSPITLHQSLKFVADGWAEVDFFKLVLYQSQSTLLQYAALLIEGGGIGLYVINSSIQ